MSELPMTDGCRALLDIGLLKGPRGGAVSYDRVTPVGSRYGPRQRSFV